MSNGTAVAEVLPTEVLRLVFEEYVELFRRDENLRIIPLLTACWTFHEGLIPVLYAHVTVSNLTQASLLSRSSTRALQSLRVLTFSPCSSVDDHEPYCLYCEDDRRRTKEAMAEWDRILSGWRPRVRDSGGDLCHMRLDRVEFCGAFALVQAIIAKNLNPQQLVWAPQNLDCRYVGPDIIDSDIFFTVAPQLGVTSWELDVTWFIHIAHQEVEKDLTQGRPRLNIAGHIYYSGTHFFRQLGQREWLSNCGLQDRIIVRSFGFPYVFWDRDGDYASRLQHVFDFRGGDRCFGPKLYEDHMIGDAFFDVVDTLVAQAGGEWAPPAAEL